MFKVNKVMIVLAGVILSFGLGMFVAANGDTIVHNIRMRYDKDYQVEYTIRQMCNQYGWTYVED